MRRPRCCRRQYTRAADPASRPNVSRIVNRSVSAWHGCNSSDRPLMTGHCDSRANSSISFCEKVRMTRTSEYELSTRATSGSDSRPLRPASCVVRNTLPPPSWIAAASKLFRVRSDGFSKISVSTRPCKRAGRSPRFIRSFRSAEIARISSVSLGVMSSRLVKCRRADAAFLADCADELAGRAPRLGAGPSVRLEACRPGRPVSSHPPSPAGLRPGRRSPRRLVPR